MDNGCVCVCVCVVGGGGGGADKLLHYQYVVCMVLSTEPISIGLVTMYCRKSLLHNKNAN